MRGRCFVGQRLPLGLLLWIRVQRRRGVREWHLRVVLLQRMFHLCIGPLLLRGRVVVFLLLNDVLDHEHDDG